MSLYIPGEVEAGAFHLVFDVRGAAGEVVFLWGVCVNRVVSFLRFSVLLGYPFTGPFV